MSIDNQNNEIKEAAIEAFLGWKIGYDIVSPMNRLRETLVRHGVDIDTRAKIYKNQVRTKEIARTLRADIAKLIVDDNVIINQGEVPIGDNLFAKTNEIQNCLFEELGLGNVEQKDKKLVVVMAIDSSGSMGMYEKYIARSLQFWLERILKAKYSNLEFRYLAHHVEAKEVSKEEFYSKGESGGTISSSAYEEMLKIVYGYTKDYSVLTVHVSDGDNLTSDNAKCKRLLDDLSKVTNAHLYLEINPYNRSSGLKSNVYNENKENQVISVIGEKNHLIYTLRDLVKHV